MHQNSIPFAYGCLNKFVFFEPEKKRERDSLQQKLTK